jgi:hypothetical protein
MGDEGDREEEQDVGTPQEPAGPEEFTSPPAVERRVWRNIYVVIAIAIIVAAVYADLQFVFGLALGGMLALLNYRWLHSSLRSVLVAGKAPPGTSLKFVFRWIVIGSVVYAASLTGYFNSIAMLLGLFAPAIAIMMEAAYVTYKTLARHGE